MNNSEKFTEQFGAKYPEVGEVSVDTVVTGEQARQFGDIIAAEVVKLSRKESLSEQEKTFIDRTASLGARSVMYLNQQKHVSIPESYAKQALTTAVWHLSGEQQNESRSLLQGLHEVATGHYSIRDTLHPEYRGSIEDTAINTMAVFGDMVENTGSIQVDDYLAGNLQHIIAGYEQLNQ